MKSAEKLFAILESICCDGDAGVTELSRKFNIGKSLIHRNLQILCELGYVQKKSQNDKYGATLKIFQVGSRVRGRISLVDSIRPYMEELGKKTNETINLALYENGEIVIIEKVRSQETFSFEIALGRRVPAYCTALGKIFLAYLEKKELDAYLEKNALIPRTENTITSPIQLKNHLQKVKKEEIAIDDGEFANGLRCIAVPVKNLSSQVIAAISIEGPSTRLGNETFDSFKKFFTFEIIQQRHRFLDLG